MASGQDVSKLFENGEGQGRVGVMPLKKISKIVRSKITERERMHKFATRFVDEGMSKEDVRTTGFFRSDMLY